MKMMMEMMMEMRMIGKMIITDINETTIVTFMYPLTEVQTWPMTG